MHSSWKSTIKGVSQASVIGPIFFNLFINEIFYFIKRARLTNYADDNTLPFAHPHFLMVKSCLEAEAEKSIWWFPISLMQANPEKFQLIFFNCKVDSPVILDGCIIKPEKVVQHLGINFDENVCSSIHTEYICEKYCLSILTTRLDWLFSERSFSATFITAQPSGITVVLQMLDVWKRFRRGL